MASPQPAPKEPAPKNERGEVILPKEVYFQLERIRKSGAVNMLHRTGVQFVANNRQMYALVVWLEDHADWYSEGFFMGFAPDTPLTDEDQDVLDEERRDDT